MGTQVDHIQPLSSLIFQTRSSGM